MKWRTKVVLVLLAAAAVVALVFFCTPVNKSRATAEATQRALDDQGFKLDLQEYQPVNSAQMQSNLRALIEAGYACSHLYERDFPNLMPSVSSNAVIVVWNRKKLSAKYTDDLWPELTARLEERRALLDQACAAALGGPIRCQLGMIRTGELVNTNLASFKHLSFGFSSRTLLELHQGNRNAAWTNLMALTRLITAWQIEPWETSHMARMALLGGAERTTWQALQTNFWTDPQLAALQREWESLNLFAGLPDTAAFGGANAVMLCRLEEEPDRTLGKLSPICFGLHERVGMTLFRIIANSFIGITAVMSMKML